jgi:hypothetical protein
MVNKYCQGCSAELMPTMRLCPQCGGKTFDSTPSKNPGVSSIPQSPQQNATGLGSNSSNASSTHSQQGLPSNADVGVKGWLLFLCISLTVITPGWILLLLSSEWRDVGAYIDTLPLVKQVLLIETISFSGIALFSCYAGWSLWTRRKGAVRIAKIYLITQCVLGILTVITLAGLLNNAEYTNGAAKGVLSAIFYLVVWYWYLSRSKRVAATYA